jgi:polyphenol oxidase
MTVMDKLTDTQPSLFQFEILKGQQAISHFVSGRDGGVSEGELGGLNLGFRTSDDPQNVTENRRRLAQAMGITVSQLIFPKQTHSSNVVAVDENTQPDDLADTDALITNVPGLCICVMSADCVPILLYDPVNRAVGAVHAGWRGTVGKILTYTVQAMQQTYGTQPADLLAGIGPSISPDIYEVGSEVLEAARQAFGNTEGLIHNENGNGKGHFNLWEANRRQLTDLGVMSASVEVSGICTYLHHDRFFSARKSANQAGRFAAGIILK